MYRSKYAYTKKMWLMNKFNDTQIIIMVGGVGSWGSLRTLLPQDEAGNAKVGKDIRLYECKNCVVHAADESKVVVQGLNGYIVAEKNGQLLVCSLKEEQRIKEFGK